MNHSDLDRECVRRGAIEPWRTVAIVEKSVHKGEDIDEIFRQVERNLPSLFHNHRRATVARQIPVRSSFHDRVPQNH